MRSPLRLGFAGSLAVLGLVAALMGCAAADALRVRPLPYPEETAQEPVAQESPAMPASPRPTVDPRLIDANTRFGFKLFSEVWKQDSGKNLMISPASVAIALSMTANGASGETREAIARALELQGMSLAEVNQANADLERLLEGADPKVKLAIANSLWGNQTVEFRPDFLNQNRQFYNAEIQLLDFNSPGAPRTINDWVSQNTAGKIPTIIDQLNPDDLLFLVNAIYFKGDWTTPFNPRETQQRRFTRLDGSSKQHPLMAQRGNYAYAETSEFQAVSLPYGDGRLSMVVFLPKTDLPGFLNTLTPENWQRWMQQLGRREGSLQLPRFKQEYGIQMNRALQALGMETAFDPSQADFSGISNTPAFISRVQHKTLIEVNEQGTEAAAATSVGVTATSLPIDPPFQMVCDRPFFYAIHDTQTGSILFMGTVVDPQ